MGESRDEFLVRVGVGTGAAAEVADDDRVLPVFFRSGDGKRETTWEGVCAAMSQAALPDFAIAGPRTVSWCLAFLRRH